MDLIIFLLKPLKYVSSYSIYIMSWSWVKLAHGKEGSEEVNRKKNPLIEHIEMEKKIN